MNVAITELTGHRVVVGVDGSDTTLCAVEWAVREAHRRGVGLHIMHAAPYLRGAADSPEQRRARAILALGYTVAHRAAPELPVATELVEGAPAEVLVAASETAVLLVLGMVGTGAVDEIVLGSVALDVSGRARSPVVVVRGRPRPDPTRPDPTRPDPTRPDPDNGPVLVGVGTAATTRRSVSRSTPPSGAVWNCWRCMCAVR